MDNRDNNLVIIKGAGDIASAVAHKLVRCGFKVIMTEIEKPTCLRRTVSFANCIYEGTWEVEGIRAKKVKDSVEIEKVLAQGDIAVVVDDKCSIKNAVKPITIIDAVLAKTNTGTQMGDAPLVIGLGPGFTAGEDVDLVVETNRGHNLGKVILVGKAEANTGIPGNIGGFSKERVLRASCHGRIYHIKRLGDLVMMGETVATINHIPVKTSISGVIRGLIYNGLEVQEGAKIGDVDPRGNRDWVYTISDKGRCIAGGVLEGIMMKGNRRGL
ncbi:selenium-dependent molybdenum cofactor biosynthesis protein YqeB [Alkaliphilus transvaalensis]|uniref:selenium-dependent molybdenum cofactor biosynthesis protein YqeB n=1 Tax=Alkaliphilus transvaalensis TaxID=114628 RepID=UPI00047B18A7|nr:selenium-dependent molybdenum cofactor biosynthesis protein YqeB [Alkaliphilus transvaalensis]